MNGMVLLGLGVLAFIAWQWGQQAPPTRPPMVIEFWFNPRTGEFVERPSISAPGPGFRPATEEEVELYSEMMIG